MKTLSVSLLCLFCLALLLGCVKKSEDLVPNAHTINHQKVKDNWVIVADYHGEYGGDEDIFCPQSGDNCHVVIEVNFPNTSGWSVFVGDTDSNDHAEVIDDCINGYTGLCAMFDSSNVDNVINGSLTIQHAYNGKLNGDWFRFVDANNAVVSRTFVQR